MLEETEDFVLLAIHKKFIGTKLSLLPSRIRGFEKINKCCWPGLMHAERVNGACEDGLDRSGMY